MKFMDLFILLKAIECREAFTIVARMIWSSQTFLARSQMLIDYEWQYLSFCINNPLISSLSLA